jgi:hypothetical protein
MTSDLLLHPFRPIGRRHLALMRQVASIQHKLLDQSTFLGFLWSFLNPLVMLVVLYAFFSQRVGSGVPHYGIYLLVGLVQFTYFSKATASGMRVLQRMRNLVINVIFPKDVLVYSALLGGYIFTRHPHLKGQIDGLYLGDSLGEAVHTINQLMHERNPLLG